MIRRNLFTKLIVSTLFLTSACASEVWYTSTDLNCRTTPQIEDNIITTYQRGTPLEIIGIDSTGQWWQTWDGNIQGWCHKDHFSPTSEPTPTPEPEMTYIGSFRLTGYCPCYSCSEGYGRQTTSGAIATAGVTVAASSQFKLGTKLYIEGVGYRVVQDRGGAIKGNRIDVFCDSHSECYAPNINCSAKVYVVN